MSAKKNRSKTAQSPPRVAVVTGTRAEFGLLEPVLRAIRKCANLDHRLIATGMHLLPRFGRTIDQIRDAGWRIHATVKMQTGRDDAAGEPAALARGISGIARALDNMNCDAVLVLGDRIEAFAGACAAAAGRRPLAHIHGGDRAVGDMDDLYRDAISRLADIHLVASQDAANRLKRMGEPASRIHRVGAPGLDDIRTFTNKQRKSRRQTDRWLRDHLGSLADRPYAVVIQHPVGRTEQQESNTMRHIITAIERTGLGGVVLYPNSDPGHAGIFRQIQQLKKRRDWRVFPSLARLDYCRLVSRSAVMVGNSSSGIIESASLGVCAVNVGPRQEGRLRCGPNVIDTNETPNAIVQAIRRATVRKRPSPKQSVYGDGHAGQRIADLIERLIKAAKKPKKRLTY